MTVIAKLPTIEGGFQFAYADPAWRFITYSEKNQTRKPPYPTMTLDELMAMPVADVMAKDSLIGMWALNTMLPEARRLMRKWGFKQVTTLFFWLKTTANGKEHFGQGYYTRKNIEVCLLGKRGKGLPRIHRDVRELITAPIREHSRKPDEAYGRIERLFGGVKKLELFARTDRGGDWTAWGNDIHHFEYEPPLLPIEEAA